MLGRTLGHYEVVDKLGAGGMGVVYKARDTHLERFVALKVLPADRVADPDRKRRFAQEARAASALNHPNIIVIHDIDEDSGVDYIAMELVAGRPLDQVITPGGVKVKDAVRLAAQIAAGLEAAHSAGIIHRDLKPANVMVSGQGHVKILDFGLAKLTETFASAAGATVTGANPRTEAGVILGTLAYMSPEQARGEELDPRTDVFSLGVMLYELVAGRRPFEGRTMADVIAAIVMSEPPALGALRGESPEELDRIVALALVKDRERRYPSMAALRRDLDALALEIEFQTRLGRATRSSPAAAAVPAHAAHNLPAQLTTFVGRAGELAEVRRLVEGHRLVALVGAGGSGKTRLALEAANGSLAAFRDGVWMVELAPVNDPDFVPAAVAAALGVREEPGRPLTTTIAEWLSSRAILLILDNCEHVIQSAARLAESLLRACHGLRILATSREALAIPGERAWRVPSLAESEAEALFAERAAAVRTGFAVDDSNRVAVAQICRRLDGLPLAIELAAARAKVLPVDQIAARLDNQFRLLAGGSRTAMPRQQTLRAMIDWSYNLLADGEKSLLRRLSVFAGGWTLEAAEAVCAGEGIEEFEVLDLLAALVEKSMVVVEEPRYRLLETIRQYAREKLVESGQIEKARRSHLAYFTASIERDRPVFYTAELLAMLRGWEPDVDNIRAALDWAVEDQPELALKLMAASMPFLCITGRLAELRQGVASAFERAGPDGPASPRGRALCSAVIAAFFQGDSEFAAVTAAKAEIYGRRAGDNEVLCYCRMHLGIHRFFVLRDPGGVEEIDESVRLARESGDEFALVIALINAAFPRVTMGSFQEAAALLAESLTISRRNGNPFLLAGSQINSAMLAIGAGDLTRAEALAKESLSLRKQMGEQWGVVQCLVPLAMVALATGRAERAARLLGAADKILLAIGAAIPLLHAPHQQCAAAARQALGDAYDAACDKGRKMTIEQAIDYGLELP